MYNLLLSIERVSPNWSSQILIIIQFKYFVFV